MTNGAPKPQIRITREAIPSANYHQGFWADVRKLVDGSWELVLGNNGKPISGAHSTKESTLHRVLTALNNLYGENGYDYLVVN